MEVIRVRRRQFSWQLFIFLLQKPNFTVDLHVMSKCHPGYVVFCNSVLYLSHRLHQRVLVDIEKLKCDVISSVDRWYPKPKRHDNCTWNKETQMTGQDWILWKTRGGIRCSGRVSSSCCAWGNLCRIKKWKGFFPSKIHWIKHCRM